MNVIKGEGGHAKAGRDNLPKAEIIETISQYDGTEVLVLRVNTLGPNQEVALSIDELNTIGMSGPAGVAELRKIREGVEEIAASTRQRETEDG